MRIWLGTILGAFAFSLALSAHGESATIGDGPSALTSVYRVGVIDVEQYRLTLSGLFGYGYTESVLADDDSHHRVNSKLSVGFSPIPWLALAYIHDLRYDRHVGSTIEEGELGLISEPRIRLRGGGELGNVRLGGEVEVWFPSTDSQSGLAAGTSVDFNLLAAYGAQRLPLIVAGLMGFRFDRSGEGSTNADALTLSDRLALGVSDSHALLLGLALQGLVGPVELLGEWTWDLHLGDEAPPPAQTPMRVSIGARYWPIEGLQLHLIMDIATVGRPAIEREQPLIAMEPRLSVNVGLSYRFAFDRDEPESESESEPEPVIRIRGRVVSPDGEWISGARVSFATRRDSWESETDETGEFEIIIDEPRSGTFSIEADDWREHTATLDVDVDNEPIEIVLIPVEGRLRGLITSAEAVSGARVRATSDERELETVSDEAGRFTFGRLPAGPVEVMVIAGGHLPFATQAIMVNGETTEVEITLEQLTEEGQLIGTVRALDGTPLAAMVRVDPIGLELPTSREGSFELNLAPGRYRLRISASGHTSQRRNVVVEQSGVTMLNIDLRPARRRR